MANRAKGGKSLLPYQWEAAPKVKSSLLHCAAELPWLSHSQLPVPFLLSRPGVLLLTDGYTGCVKMNGVHHPVGYSVSGKNPSSLHFKKAHQQRPPQNLVNLNTTEQNNNNKNPAVTICPSLKKTKNKTKVETFNGFPEGEPGFWHDGEPDLGSELRRECVVILNLSIKTRELLKQNNSKYFFHPSATYNGIFFLLPLT